VLNFDILMNFKVWTTSVPNLRVRYCLYLYLKWCWKFEVNYIFSHVAFLFWESILYRLHINAANKGYFPRRWWMWHGRWTYVLHKKTTCHLPLIYLGNKKTRNVPATSYLFTNQFKIMTIDFLKKNFKIPMDIRSRKSKKDSQHNGLREKDITTNNGR
jgi:hypothetical protein